MIKIALFGLGRIGQMHGQNLFNHKEFELKYVYDVNKKLADKVKLFRNSEMISI